MKHVSKMLLAVFITVPCAIFAAEFDDFDITSEVNSALFIVGRDTQSGVLSYAVDRTTGLCFAMWGGGLTLVDCEKLKNIPAIKTYIETGKTP